MSTKQLTYPEKIYEVSDELESFFFVIFYEGVHWVTHNKPMCLNVKYIFDQMERVVGGNHIGGAGKQNLYERDEALIFQQLEFTKSKPFTNLIRQLYYLFRSLHIFNLLTGVRISPSQEFSSSVEKVKDCKEVIRLMKEAVERKDWPEELDKVTEDNYPREEEMDEKEPTGLSHLDKVNSICATGVKRRLEVVVGGDGLKTPTKRPRVNY